MVHTVESAATESTEPRDAADHPISPSDIAVGVIIGRTSEFFDFFVFAIASVIVFPARLFPFLEPLEGTLASFVLILLAFVARPIGNAVFMRVDRNYGRGAKLTIALFLLGTSTVAMGLVPSYATVGVWAIVIMAICDSFRVWRLAAHGTAWHRCWPSAHPRNAGVFTPWCRSLAHRLG